MSPAGSPSREYFPLAIPLADRAWDRFAVADALAGAGGDPARTLRLVAPRIDAAVPPPAEHLLALRTVNTVLRWLARRYVEVENPGSLGRGRARAAERLGPEHVTRALDAFAALYPSAEVRPGGSRPPRFGAGGAGENVADEATLEMVMLFLNAVNPAAAPAAPLFDDSELQQKAGYLALVTDLEKHLETAEPAGAAGQPLFALLRAPLQASPHSLDGQLRWMLANWAELLPPDLLGGLQSALDVLSEVDVRRAGEPGPPPVLEFGPGTAGWGAHGPEPEAFSEDAAWMANVVLMAKSAYVWLDQLSRWHGRPIRTLADIPDEELDRLAAAGINGLWLIGLWERSTASRTIKQWMGNPDAAASAYALKDYAIAADLGGEEAWRVLRDRAWARGIRLASDMVPNHMGIDSNWVVDHPEYFLQLDHPPYPNYRFGCEDLCGAPGVGVRIEDGYWNHSDAAVVFERVDEHTGQRRYIYHGNDGTSMPWNDTAQLNFMLPEVRRAVSDIILHVARMFPIIRFDAAMTLAKKHYQRLWFPAPGDAGAIPTRAEHGLSKPDFDAAFPVEFWREVVDRVAAEAPDTLLLAEAFWLMEGYFVRTLGMHRVYNSAFMNMLKMEDNQKYRQTIKNVLEFSPAVLGRFVNFMNNPDEKTAVEQFGRGDKYFGCCILLATMPGLPMIGHGQIEGFTEKYGMEYRRAYWDEPVDQEMVRRHEREIFPLLRRRGLFSGVAEFALFDFESDGGWVDENVFAYSNRAHGQAALVLYNNAYESTSGCVRMAAAVNRGSAEQPHLVRRSLAEALGIDPSPGVWYAWRDGIEGLEYLASGAQLAENGYRCRLGGYQSRVLLDFRRLEDPDGAWADLAGDLAGRGVPDLQLACRRRELAPQLALVRSWMTPAVLGWLETREADDDDTEDKDAEAAAETATATAPPPGLPTPLALLASALRALPARSAPETLGRRSRKELQDLLAALPHSRALQAVYLAAVLDEAVRPGHGLPTDAAPLVADDIEAALLDWLGHGHAARQTRLAATALAALAAAPAEFAAGRTGWVTVFLDRPEARELLGINEHEGEIWLSAEGLDDWLLTVALAALAERPATDPVPLLDARGLVRDAAQDAGYRLKEFRRSLGR
jgi:glycosidase